MPPKAKFSKDEIILAAVQIVREQGPDAVTSRELGKRLGSSSCPIFTVFKNMEEVNTEIIRYAKNLYKEYVNEGLRQEIAFRGVGTAYVKFAIQEPKLFQLLFMKEQETPTDAAHTLMFIDENYKDILKSIIESYEMNEKDAMKIYKHLWIYTHGIATLCATNVCVFEAAEIQTMMTEIFRSLLEKMKRGELGD